MVYHGTKSKVVSSILEQGFNPSIGGFYNFELNGINLFNIEMDALYISPSIEYAGHPRYATPIFRENKWVQVVLQLRVNPQLLILKRPGALKGANPEESARADPNFSNNQLEWLLSALPGTQLSADSVVINGIMLRVTDEHPKKLPCTQWWEGRRPIVVASRSLSVFSKLQENCVIS